MTIVVRASDASLDANQARQVLAGNVFAGEALDAVAPCYLKTSDGKVYLCDGAANNEAAEFIGFTARAVAIGQPVTLFGAGSRFKFSSGMDVGAILYLRDADSYYDAGNLDTATTPGDTLGTAVAISATDILVTRTRVQGG